MVNGIGGHLLALVSVRVPSPLSLWWPCQRMARIRSRCRVAHSQFAVARLGADLTPTTNSQTIHLIHGRPYVGCSVRRLAPRKGRILVPIPGRLRSFDPKYQVVLILSVDAYVLFPLNSFVHHLGPSVLHSRALLSPTTVLNVLICPRCICLFNGRLCYFLSETWIDK